MAYKRKAFRSFFVPRSVLIFSSGYIGRFVFVINLWKLLGTLKDE
jgi:hypothetical protein